MNLKCLFGYVEMREMPMIRAGNLFGIPYQYTQYDGNNKITDQYITKPAVWFTGNADMIQYCYKRLSNAA